MTEDKNKIMEAAKEITIAVVQTGKTFPSNDDGTLVGKFFENVYNKISQTVSK